MLIFKNMKIVAIDFETANNRSASAISIGYAVIEDNLIVEYKNQLIKPHNDYNEFLPQNMKIHHITPKMVSNKPSFKEVYYSNLQKVFENSILVAHNAPFDMRVLKSLFALYEIPLVNYKYFCTVELSTHLWPKIENHRLHTVAQAIGFNLGEKHHDSMYDALACAKIVNAAMKDCDVTTPESLCFMTNTKMGTILNTNAKGWNELKLIKPDLNNLNKITESNYTNHLYYGKKIAKVGDFKNMPPENVAQHLANIEGEYHEFILKDTDFVVISDKYYTLFNEEKESGKRQRMPKVIRLKIQEAQKKNKNIISETTFKSNLFNYEYLDNNKGIPKYCTFEYL